MADNTNPTARNTTAVNFLPNFYRSDANKKFLHATIEQLTQPGTVKKITGYIGRPQAKATVGSDIFVEAADSTRQNYQLEPGMVITDALGNTTFFKDYIDYINQLGVFGGNITNHSRINKQEFYSWNPHIDFDKFVNFQNYYWLPYGPDSISIYGQLKHIISTYTVVVESEGNNNTYLFTPNGLTRNPTLTLYRGQTYKFDINSPGNPFSIKQLRSSGASDRYISDGIDNQAVETGTITFTVPHDSPSVLYYQSENDADLGGTIHVKEIAADSSIDVTTDVLGKKAYILSDGIPLSNGMKVTFGGVVTPAEYATGTYYVEGVGTAIKLIDASTLDIASSFTSANAVLFGESPFDSLPFSEATSYAGISDYIVMNRACRDNNPWSRMNRWCHIDVIKTTAFVNGTVVSLDQTARAIRAIIEFDADLRLYNYGTSAIPDVDVIDTHTTDVFSDIEGAIGYNIDGVDIIDGMTILFTADLDIMVRNKIFQVKIDDFQHLSVNSGSYTTQLHLVEVSAPVADQVVLIHSGTLNKGDSYWYNGTTSDWELAQRKTKVNQPPLFDIVDNNGVSFGDTAVYNGSTFAGTTLFSYKVGSGTIDTALGFPLTHKNINNIGDIVFNFNLVSDIFRYKSNDAVIDQSLDVGYIPTLDYTGNVIYVNGWQTNLLKNTQAAIRVYKSSNKTNNFDIDIYDNINALSDLDVKIYINGAILSASLWNLISGPTYKQIKLDKDISLTDVLTIRAFSSQPVNSTGYYEIPLNLQNNPLNESMGDFTLGEVFDHVASIIDNAPGFSGIFPGASNLRDLGNVTQYGTKFLQHSGPASLSLYHITNESNNIIRSIEKSRDDYGKFKRSFLSIAGTLGVDTDPVTHVDLVLRAMNKSKPITFPYYFSDMVATGAHKKTVITVVDYRIQFYPLTTVFSLSVLSNQSVIVYLNDTQLLYDRDYTFDPQGFVVVSATMESGDTITICEYENTSGCFMPETPTKLGIWPKYEPKIYVDTSLVTPRTMIQGHDGSLVLAYGDFRDGLILELESRIYNNIKVVYDTTIFDVDKIIPGYVNSSEYTQQEFNAVLAPSFYQWSTLVDKDFTKPLSYDRNNSFTYNYTGHSAPDGREVPGYWRGIYQWLLGTDRPHICPWEMLGFRVEPKWWQSVYGPAPYTSDNLVLWSDLSNGLVKQPGIPAVVSPRYIKPFLMDRIPVDESGNLISPVMAGLATGIITVATGGDFVFGDISPIEATWRRSSYYPFSILITSMLLTPSNTFGLLLDRSRIIRNITGQLIYKDTGLRVTPADIKLPNISNSVTMVQTAGIINYIVNYILSDNLLSYNNYSIDLKNISAKLSHRVGSFTSKDKLNLILDSRTPLSIGTVFVPPENYNIILNSSSPIKKITYSGVIITKLADGYSVKGYSYASPYFNYYGWTHSGTTVNVGGISESYLAWHTQETYSAGKVVLYNKKYYRVVTQHTSTHEFDSTQFAVLTGIPISGGKTAILRNLWDRTETITIPYNTIFPTVQRVVDFLLGYGEYLKDQGFIFDDFNTVMTQVTNWETSAKEFLFWTTQNWSTGQDKWEDWKPDVITTFGSIVRYDGDYYSAIRTSIASPTFMDSDFVKLDGLSSVGSSVISLSPSAGSISFTTPLCVVDDITNEFNGYSIVRVDGRPIERSFLNSYREDNAVSYTPRNSDGIYGASFYLIQSEQVVILDNSTIFNDTIYNPVSGYKQDRIKVSGYVSSNWNGSFDVPGFIFDNAVISNWEPWQDYALGDIVVYLQFYYSAIGFTHGAETFDFIKWYKLSKKPLPALYPNLNYKASQFEDFYSLSSDNFDTSQQKFAQHLIGYQKRQYLENIIQDDVSEFNFYQGMIKDKGTQNVLNKLFDVLSADGEESLTFYEEWAVRVGQYGACASFENIEFVIDASLVRSNPQGFELVNTVDTSIVDFIIRQAPTDIYLPPVGYTSAPWPLMKNKNQLLRSAGYVMANDVSYSIKSLDNIRDIDSAGAPLYPISSFISGDYVWCSFDNAGWNVYRFTHTSLTVSDLTYTNNTLTVVTNALIPYEVGTYIGLRQVCDANAIIPKLDGFYKILSVDKASFAVAAVDLQLPSPFTTQSTVLVFAMTPQRVDSIDNVDTVLPYPLRPNEMVWTDDRGDGTWASWKHNSVYTPTLLHSNLLRDGLKYGKALAIDTTGALLVVSTSLGTVSVYDRESPLSNFVNRQQIYPPFINDIGDNNTDNIATVMAISPDSRWLVTGSHAISHARYTTNGFVNVTIDSPLHTNSSIMNHGVISIYEKDVNNIYTVVDTILSPAPTADEHFGASVVFGIDRLYIGATGGTGKVYQLLYDTVIHASTAYLPAGSLETSYVVTADTTAKSNILSNVSNISSLMIGYGISGNGIITGTTITGIDLIGNTVTVSHLVAITLSDNTINIQVAHVVIQVVNTTGIAPGMVLSGIGFTNSQTVVSVIDMTTLVISSNADSEPFGVINFSTTQWRYSATTYVGESPDCEFGSSLVISADGSTLIVSAPGNSYANGKLYVYKFDQPVAMIEETPFFGIGVTVSDDGTYIAASYLTTVEPYIRQTPGIHIYKLVTRGISSMYILYQEINNVQPVDVASFGSKLMFMNESSTLVVYSTHATTEEVWHVTDSTTFDEDTTHFILSISLNSGRVDIYDRYATKWVYSESLESSATEHDGYGTAIVVVSNLIVVSSPYAYENNISIGSMLYYNANYVSVGTLQYYTKPLNTRSWEISNYAIPQADSTKIKKAFLYNRRTNELVTYLDVIDPTYGKIPGIADEEISYKTYYDPAIYSIGDATVNVDDGAAWKSAQVGALWWDLRTAKFVDNDNNDIVYRNSTWGTLAVGASIDIYEWVQSSYLPADWDIQADTESGLAVGISGTTIHGNASYCIKSKYDNISQTFKKTYYFWVKNKKTIPAVVGRYMSASDTSSLISNPRGAGYQYLALTSVSSFSMVNVGTMLKDTEVVLSVEYWTIDKIDQNIHSHWKLISNDASSVIPVEIEKKWIDSLCGSDVNGRLVPDISAPLKYRYGVENKPRQSMLINRFEALKQYIEYTNILLSKHLISDTRNLSNLLSYNAEPTKTSGMFDVVIDTDAELIFANAGLFRRPTATPIIVNGRITGINILTTGRGYLTAPYIEIVGTGINAVIRASINAAGQIIGYTIIDGGIGYNANTTLVIRDYAVLVHSDSQSAGIWSIYSYDPTASTWSRTQSQTYDTRKYWRYVDWYATGFNQFSAIVAGVDTYYELATIEISIGELVKVRATNNGSWVILQKYSNVSSIDWTTQYVIVGNQNGTIEFIGSLYNAVNTVVGYDNALYDNGIFDNSSSTELRIILTAIKQDILIDELSSEYLNLFFNTVRYVLFEQPFVDWVFKTSFVNATHNIGPLRQLVTYRNDNLINFEEYVAEVKPYRTKVRQYISNYTSLDNTSTAVMDFDLPPVIDNGAIGRINVKVVDEKLLIDNSAIQQYPWKHWLDNIAFTLKSIVVATPGSGYLLPPTVRVVSASGSGAIATAFISHGKVIGITIIAPGSGYLSAPTIYLDGGLSLTGVPAKAVAIIQNDQLRSTLIKIKFDRISQTYFITELQEIERFTGGTYRVQFPLKWAPDVRIGTSTVTVNGAVALRDSYTLKIVKSTILGYTSYAGTIVFGTAPVLGATIEVTYLKDWTILNAADRINYYYNPQTGDLGKDLSQLMTGIDYGGVIVDGLAFDVSRGWDSVPFYSDKWDQADPTFKDYIVTVRAGEHNFVLPYLPLDGVEINIYQNHVRIDDPSYGTVNQLNDTALMPTWVSSGNGQSITIPTRIEVNEGDLFIFRESTSDGSINPQSSDYDTALSGGDLSYQTAAGIAADDIIVDGDGFVTPTTSTAPEEVVPGQLMDAVAIKVYDRPSAGSASINVDNYIANGVKVKFKITHLLNSSRALLVQVNIGGISEIKTIDVDYIVDYKNSYVVFNSAPTTNSIVSIFEIGKNGNNILDIAHLIGDGITVDFITIAPWVTSLTSVVYVNGMEVPYKLQNAGDTVVIVFAIAPLLGDVIDYIIINSAAQLFSVTRTEKLPTDGRAAGIPYELSYPIGNVLPNESYVIVRAGSRILSSGNNEYYDIQNNTLVYAIDPLTPPYSVDATNIVVYVSGIMLSIGSDYSVDFSGISIILTQLIYDTYVGHSLVISITNTQEYTIIPATRSTPASILFTESYSSLQYVEIISSYNQDVMDIHRIGINASTSLKLTQDTPVYYHYKNVLGGILLLDRPVINDNYVWVIKNGVLLSPSIDYKLNSDKISITVSVDSLPLDAYTIITFGSNLIVAGVSYMQFKDMLNRLLFKRLNLNKQTTLAVDLHWNDTSITVTDASNFDMPNPEKNRPGIIEIRGERIEFFGMTGNVLSKLRRGTLGTGAPAIHLAGGYVQEIGYSETMPYHETTITKQIVSDGSNTVQLPNLVPTKGNETWSYAAGFASSIPAQYGQSDDIEVFVGGYNITAAWASNVSYSVGDIVIVGSYTYTCTVDHISETSFTSGNWSFFIGNIRLKKKPYKVHNVSINADSPVGDVQFDADFSVDGFSNSIRLTNQVAAGTQITVVKRVGTSWDQGTSIQLSDDKNATFLRAVPGIWYTNMR